MSRILPHDPAMGYLNFYELKLKLRVMSEVYGLGSKCTVPGFKMKGPKEMKVVGQDLTVLRILTR